MRRGATAQRRAGRFTRWTLAVLACTAVVAAPHGPATAAPSPAPRPTAAGGIGLRLLDAPVTAQGDPRARLYIVDHLAPGRTITRRVEVANTTAASVHVVLYPAAAQIINGAFIGADGRTRNDLSTWTTVDPAGSDVPAGARVTVTVTVAVPRDAAPGEQYAVLWAEVRAASSTGGVTQVNRVGVRLYLSVGPGGPPAANFAVTTLTAQHAPDGRPMISATVHNSGGRALDMSGTLLLTGGPGGLSAGPFPVSLGTTLGRGDTAPVTIVLDREVPAGPWEAEITLRSGLLERSTNATITFPATGAAPAVATGAAEPARPAWLYPAIAALLALLTAVGLAVLLRRQRRRPEPRPTYHQA